MIRRDPPAGKQPVLPEQVQTVRLDQPVRTGIYLAFGFILASAVAFVVLYTISLVIGGGLS